MSVRLCQSGVDDGISTRQLAGRVSKVTVLLMSANLNATWKLDCPHLSTLRGMGYVQNDRSIGGASPKTRGDFWRKEERGG